MTTAVLEAPAAPEAPAVRVTTTISADEWDSYVRGHPAATRYHPWAWREIFERAFHHETIYLAACRQAGPTAPTPPVAGQRFSVAESGSCPTTPVVGQRFSVAERDSSPIVGVLPLVAFRSLLFGRFLVSLPFVNYGGVLADDGEAARALLGAASEEGRRRQVRHIELRHTVRTFPELPAKQHKVAMTLPLPADADTAWKGFDNKLRNQIRKAQKGDLEVLCGGAELVDDFYVVFARNMRDLGTPVYSKRLFSEVLTRVPETRVFIVLLAGRPVAAGITIGYRGAVENPWASSLREHRSLNPNMLLYWTMIQDAIARGYKVFDFGRSSPNEGTYNFKKQWGAIESPFYWEYVLRNEAPLPDQSPKSTKFSLAVSAWQRLPLTLTNLLGPPVVRNIP
ncbi:MAG: FemAB family PEP-CTERM system-associated protein [Acidobacteria bacterium]|nr:MAG: FemAB family PEP-CTERM system-associated protein [Acidobacteriota bacterium]